MRGRTAASTAAVLLSGAAFGAAAVLLGGFVVRGLGEMSYECEGSWPEGVTVWWWLLAGAGLLAVGGLGYALGRHAPTAVEEEPRDAVPEGAKAWGPTGEESRVRAAVLNKHDRPAAAEPEPAALGTAGRAALAVGVCLGLLAGAWGVWPAGEEGAAEAGRPQAKPPARPALAWRVPVAGADRRPGAWGLGDVVVDGRIDGLYAYGARDGKARWNVSAPAREAVCAMSPRVGRNIGLIAYGRDGKPCATLLAVHTTTGEVLWREPVGGAGVGGVAVADTTTVAVEDRAVRGRSAESGEQRWQRALGRECEVRALDADGDRTLLVEQCGEGARLLALDTATGKERWNRALPVESAVRARVVSVTPAVIALDERDKRGSHALLGFDATGTPKATVPLTGADGTVTAFDDERPLVFGDLLVTRVERSSSVATSVVAYSLKDGRKVWQHRTDAGMFESLARQPDGTVAVLVRGRLQVLLLDPATGRVRGERTPRTEEQPLSIYPELIPVPGGHVVVNHITMNGEPGLFAIR